MECSNFMYRIFATIKCTVLNGTVTVKGANSVFNTSIRRTGL